MESLGRALPRAVHLERNDAAGRANAQTPANRIIDHVRRWTFVFANANQRPGRGSVIADGAQGPAGRELHQDRSDFQREIRRCVRRAGFLRLRTCSISFARRAGSNRPRPKPPARGAPNFYEIASVHTSPSSHPTLPVRNPRNATLTNPGWFEKSAGAEALNRHRS